MKNSTETVQLVPGNSLLTKTPEEGRALAVKMARLIIKATQPDAAIREKLRPIYAEDAGMLIAIGHTVALEFSTIAAANNYWKDVVLQTNVHQPPTQRDAQGGNTSHSRNEHALTVAMADIRARAEVHGEPSLRNGALYFGATAIPKPDYEIVTAIQSAHGCTATIFAARDKGFIRVATNIFRAGNRGIGTELDPSGPVIEPLRKGLSYRGQADILGVLHDTYYEPIKDSTGAVIGAFLVGFPLSMK
jgi:hypothetical protein